MLPYTRDIKQQTIAGELSKLVSDHRYRSAAKDIARAVM